MEDDDDDANDDNDLQKLPFISYWILTTPFKLSISAILQIIKQRLRGESNLPS